MLDKNITQKKYLTNMKKKYPDKWTHRMHKQAFYNAKSYIKQQASWDELQVLLETLITKLYVSDPNENKTNAKEIIKNLTSKKAD